MHPFHALTAGLAEAGLNLVGVADPDAWNAAMGPQRTTTALWPATRAIVVVGNGGPAMWSAFTADLRAHPEHLTAEANPLDAFARRAVRRADAALGDTPRRWFWAAADAELHVDFRVLARLAGLGRASRLGLLLNETWGPWLGLRAACFVDLPIPAATPLASADDELSPHCAGCDRCVTACPGAAFPAGRWAVDVCSTWHHLSDRCASTCHARVACPVAADQRYSDAELTYHSNRAQGRAALRAMLGLDRQADGFEGIGPHWMDWRTRVDVAGG